MPKHHFFAFQTDRQKKKIEQKIKDLKGNRRKPGSCNVKHVLLVCWSEIDCNKTMSPIQFLDDLIREYLLFRGFVNTLKLFDGDVKAEKDKGLRSDK